MDNNDRRKMCLKDWIKILIPAVLLAITGMTGYFDLKARVSVAETKIEQETQGYFTIQKSITSRLERIEQKLDCMNDRRFCR